MTNSNYYYIAILKFIYVQPEVSVSIDKILQKFTRLTKDDVLTLLTDLEKEGFVVLGPTSSFSFVDVKTNKSTPVVNPSYVELTLAGKTKAEEKRVLLLKARRELIIKPFVNTLVSSIVGFILGIVFSYFIIK